MTVAKQIGIAVVEHDGRYLVGIRGPGIPLAGYAEFPGGKCLDGESPTDCAVRECLEESELRVVPNRILQDVEFEYPHGKVHLHFVECHPADVKLVNERHGHFHWADLAELKTMQFPEANAGIVRLLTGE